jgi:predicted HicB family RNase H-like nuclease
VKETKYLLSLVEDLHKKAKIQAVSEGVTMNEIITKALKEYLKRKGVK